MSKTIALVLLFGTVALKADGDTYKVRRRHALADELGMRKELGILDRPSLNIFRNSCHALGESPLPGRELFYACKVITNSRVCKRVADKANLLDCKNFGNEQDFDPLARIASCAEGMWDSVWDILEFLWTVLVNIHKVPGKFMEYAESLQLYLANEYDLAQEEVSPPKALNALRAVGQKAATALWDGLTRLAAWKYHEFGCLNRQAQVRRICWLMGTFATPWAMLKAIKLSHSAFTGSKVLAVRGFAYGRHKTPERSVRVSLAIGSRAEKTAQAYFKTLKKLERQGKVQEGLVKISFAGKDGTRGSGFVQSITGESMRLENVPGVLPLRRVHKNQIVSVSVHAKERTVRTYARILELLKTRPGTPVEIGFKTSDGSEKIGRVVGVAGSHYLRVETENHVWTVRKTDITGLGKR